MGAQMLGHILTCPEVKPLPLCSGWPAARSSSKGSAGVCELDKILRAEEQEDTQYKVWVRQQQPERHCRW